VAKPGKIMRLHKAANDAIQARFDMRAEEKAIQSDVLDYYGLLADALRTVRLNEDELRFLHWLFSWKKVERHERRALASAVMKMSYEYPWQDNLKPATFAAKLASYSPLELLAISDAMERAVSHPSYNHDRAAMYRAVGLLPPSAGDPFPRPPQPAIPQVISSEVLRTSDTWHWPPGNEQFIAWIKMLALSPEEVATVDRELVGLPFVEQRALLAEHSVLLAVSERMEQRRVPYGLWNTLRDMVEEIRVHPDYANDPVAAYRAAGLCA